MNNDNTVSAKKKVAEAQLRMKKMQFNSAIIDAFVEKGKVTFVDSLTGSQQDLNDSQLQFVKDFESDGKTLVYLVIGSQMLGMSLESYIYVSDYEDEWVFDHADIDEGYLMTYTRNLTSPHLSEYGSIPYCHHPNGFPVRASASVIMTIEEGPKEQGEITRVLAMIHSRNDAELVEMICQTGENDYIIKTQAGVCCHAIFNPFTMMFYADDLYRKVEGSELYKCHFGEDNHLGTS